MSLDLLVDTENKTNKAKEQENQSFFVMKCLKHNDITLNDEMINHEIIRCQKCGFPLKTLDKGVTTNELKSMKSFKFCRICKRERTLNAVLISSYVASAGLFIALIIGVILDKLTLDISLLIGCLEIIFLLFFGRFLEEAVFFGLQHKDKILSALYRFSISSEMQAYEVAMKYLRDLPEDKIDSDILKGILQVIAYQSNNLPVDWFYELSQKLDTTPKDFLQKLSEQFDELEELNYLDKLIANAPSFGITTLIEIFLITQNISGLETIEKRISEILNQDKIPSEWLNDFYIYHHRYEAALSLINKLEILTKIDELLVNFKEPRVPTIDVIESSKNIIQRNPAIRYVLRIFLYLALAFVLGLLYRLFD
ncbi:MAG: hypothetical protein FK734_08750 [Asgard group archaeon]|nr:hypothetical protein [Asgard group archaeon]